MKFPCGLRIGITIGLRHANESLWVNGIKQNALYLAKLFQNSPLGHDVVLVNTTDVPVTSALPWDVKQFPTATFEDEKDKLDVLIELGGQISSEQTAYLKSQDTRIVSYCCGPEYVQMTEAMIFGRRLTDHVFINQHYDQVWVIPQVMETTAGFLGVLRRREVVPVPFVWDPMCLDMRVANLPCQGEYRPGRAPAKRVSVMEPNIDVLKFCLNPMLIAESAYREVGDELGFVHVTNAEHLARSCPEFIGIAHYLDLVRDGKMSFVGRHDTPQFLAEHTDIVVSHQWGLSLNYFYFDVAWNGYALVHNARLCEGIGYYYQESDLDAGARQLVHAIRHHDDDFDAYRERQRAAIAPFLATHEPLVARYDQLLGQLVMRGSPAAIAA
ncbi:DUF2827 domain-containing protein [Burkholderia vietnamiensis]|uniref:DUF2827 domain-containing protein n=1 Tax=Burkholderia vietnamiensis TaxID=60552 RepID=UPI001593D0E2|nr:DUF2827 domain-containing protein [Burkholderia vietnamiensis]WHU95790.1 DUF2827 domain-containing protein [Burkholderia vietnamiensis]CAG9200628.1 conserved hypothetical protein [Burkholderia vietnamiensis]HDR9157056.1 DUF2827 domain-containing protein [Burkholderia vietnamiensis]